MNAVALIQFSAVDLPTLLPLGRQAFDRSLSEPADSVDSEPPLHHMLCIAAMKEPNLRPSAESCKPYLNLFHAGFMVAADERDFAEIFEVAGMPCIMAESVQRGINAAFIAGTLDQWRAAVLRGCVVETSYDVRETFNKIYYEFNKMGLAPIFEARKKESPTDSTFFLEHHR